MKVFVIEFEEGEYEFRENYTVAVYDDLQKATDYLISCGFYPIVIDDGGTDFRRDHQTVTGQCVEHTDWAAVKQFELNKPSQEHKNVFEKHYK